MLVPKPKRLRVLFLTLAPPEDHCGVRLIVYRHLIERCPFELGVVTNTTYVTQALPHVRLRLPKLLERLRRTRLSKWVVDFENVVWPLWKNRVLNELIQKFKPDVLLTVADASLSCLALRAARRFRIPLGAFFLDWFPIMDGHFGHKWSQPLLSRRFRALYRECDLAFCTSEGMKETLGPHRNSHVVYPLPGRHTASSSSKSRHNCGRFRIVYVGSVERFYGRMLCSLLEEMSTSGELELVIVGPNADWPPALLAEARQRGWYLGFKPQAEAAEILAGADALLIVMSFEPEYRLFMETSFTTKFLDYVAFEKPIVVWGPEYCTPVKLVRKEGGACVVNQPDAQEVVLAFERLAADAVMRNKLIRQATSLHESLFNPERLQDVFVAEIEKLVIGSGARRTAGSCNQSAATGELA